MRIAEVTAPAQHQAPLAASQLDKLGVRIKNRHDLELECKSCGERWAPEVLADGNLRRGYWKCPNRCNW
jgi:hypothetical protein